MLALLLVSCKTVFAFAAILFGLFATSMVISLCRVGLSDPSLGYSMYGKSNGHSP